MELHAGGHFTIPQTAKILKVTEKTIRNYIERGILFAQKWNGSWRIREKDLLEFHEKKFGKFHVRQMHEILPGPEDDIVKVPTTEYSALQKQVGQKEAHEALIAELKQETKRQEERLVQLEASAASAWTEAKRAKEDLVKAQESLKASESRERQALEEIAWLRREMDRMRTETHRWDVRVKTLERQNALLAQQAHERARGILPE